MSDTPSTEEVRREFAEQYASPGDHYPRFDRWLADLVRKVRAEERERILAEQDALYEKILGRSPGKRIRPTNYPA